MSELDGELTRLDLAAFLIDAHIPEARAKMFEYVDEDEHQLVAGLLRVAYIHGMRDSQDKEIVKEIKRLGFKVG